MKNLPEFEGSMLEAFADTSLGNLHTIDKDGTVYVPAIETALLLGYKNPRDAIRRHCKYETAAVDEWVVTGTKADGSDAAQRSGRKIEQIHRSAGEKEELYTECFDQRRNGEKIAGKQADGPEKPCTVYEQEEAKLRHAEMTAGFRHNKTPLSDY